MQLGNLLCSNRLHQLQSHILLSDYWKCQFVHCSSESHTHSKAITDDPNQYYQLHISNNDCTRCTHNMCCGSSFTVIPIHCSTMSTYSALTPSSQSFDEYTALVTSSLSVVNPPVSSVPLIRTHLSPTHGYTHTLLTLLSIQTHLY